VAEHWAAINVQTDAVFDELEDVFFAKGGYSIPEHERELVDSTGEPHTQTPATNGRRLIGCPSPPFHPYFTSSQAHH
jgi:hypothetical protein